MKDLIARLEALNGPNFAMEEALHALVPPPKVSLPLNYTSRVDEALTLVPKGKYWSVWTSAVWEGGKHYAARIFISGGGWVEDTELGTGNGPTAAIAICIAALRARDADGQSTASVKED